MNGPVGVPVHPRADVVIRDVAGRDELDAARSLLGRIWPRPDGCPPIHLEMLRAVAHAGSMVLGAYRSGDLVGVAVGLLGVVHGDPHLHSHVVGVRPDVQGQGVGAALKWHQRHWCQERGVQAMTWTFDPLVRRNAWVNISKLGAFGTGYHEDFYGAMPDEVNAGLPTDRCMVTWELDSARVTAAAQGRLPVPSTAAVMGSGGRVVLDVDMAGEPAVTPHDSLVRLARVPADLLEPGRAADPERALRWRHALRETMVGALGTGLVLSAVTHDGWYVMAVRQPAEGAPQAAEPPRSGSSTGSRATGVDRRPFEEWPE